MLVSITYRLIGCVGPQLYASLLFDALLVDGAGDLATGTIEGGVDELGRAGGTPV